MRVARRLERAAESMTKMYWPGWLEIHELSSLRRGGSGCGGLPKRARVGRIQSEGLEYSEDNYDYNIYNTTLHSSRIRTGGSPAAIRSRRVQGGFSISRSIIVRFETIWASETTSFSPSPANLLHSPLDHESARSEQLRSEESQSDTGAAS